MNFPPLRTHRLGTLLVLAWAALVFTLPSSALAKEKKPEGRALGFSALVFRLQNEDRIGLVQDDYPIHILEHLRKKGVNAVGAENIVFGKDNSGHAQLMLGGTVKELQCRSMGTLLSCRIGVEWQLMDVRTKKVIYQVLSRAGVPMFGASDLSWVPKKLILNAVDALLARHKFQVLLKRDAVTGSSNEVKTVTYGSCGRAPLALPAGADAALDATVVIKSKEGFGSGFFLNSEGLILTAAHVVDGANDLTVHTRSGFQVPATVVRMDRASDVALLRVKAKNQPCLTLSTTLPKAGAEAYAMGSPADEKLAFSVSRGIVSGVRSFDEQQRIQTDASVSPGNSGGPLVGKDGRVLGVVSSKLVGGSVEGIAFGVPVGLALKALGLSPGTQTHPLLMSEVAKMTPTRPLFVDSPDQPPSFNPKAKEQSKRNAVLFAEDRKREKEADLAQRNYERELAAYERKRPATVPILRWGGVTSAGIGTILIVGSALIYEKDFSTRPAYIRNRRANDFGWVFLTAGTAAFVGSFFLGPKKPKEPPEVEARLRFSPTHVELGVTY